MKVDDPRKWNASGVRVSCSAYKTRPLISRSIDTQVVLSVGNIFIFQLEYRIFTSILTFNRKFESGVIMTISKFEYLPQ